MTLRADAATTSRVLGFVLVTCCCAAAHAEPLPVLATSPAPPPVGVTGDWGGVRSDLDECGIGLVASYVAQGAYNAQGGLRRRATSANQAMIGTTLDLDRLARLGGVVAQIRLTYRHGDDLASKAGFPHLQPIQEIYGRGRVVRLTEAWVEARLSNDVLVRGGRMPAGDFAAFSCEFQSLALCGSQPGHTVSDYWLVWPVSQWGAWVRYGSDRQVYVQVGAYQVTKANLDEDALEIGSLTKATGVLLPFEVAAFPVVGRAGLAGSFKVGVWYDTTNAADVFLNRMRRPLATDGGLALRRSGRYGGYLSFVQELFRLPPGPAMSRRGLSAFLHVVKADQATALYDFALATGVLFKGPFESRPDDLMGAGFATTRVNPRTRLGQTLLDPRTAQRSERVVELFYGAAIRPAVRVQPGIQYVMSPGGLEDQQDVVAPTLKVSVQF